MLGVGTLPRGYSAFHKKSLNRVGLLSHFHATRSQRKKEKKEKNGY
jgi:hypothetical protein